jgi:hypothetical protein
MATATSVYEITIGRNLGPSVVNGAGARQAFFPGTTLH